MSKLISLLHNKSKIMYSLYVGILLICIIAIFFNNLIPDLPILFSGGSAKEIQIKELIKIRKNGTYIIDSNNIEYRCFSTLSKYDFYTGSYSDIKNNKYMIKFLPNSKIVLKIHDENKVIYSIWSKFGNLLLFIVIISLGFWFYRRRTSDLDK